MITQLEKIIFNISLENYFSIVDSKATLLEEVLRHYGDFQYTPTPLDITINPVEEPHSPIQTIRVTTRGILISIVKPDTYELASQIVQKVAKTLNENSPLPLTNLTIEMAYSIKNASLKTTTEVFPNKKFVGLRFKENTTFDNQQWELSTVLTSAINISTHEDGWLVRFILRPKVDISHFTMTELNKCLRNAKNLVFTKSNDLILELFDDES